MDKIEKIRQEIERRKQSLRAGICNPDAFTRKQKLEMLVASEELDRLNRFLDTLSEEPCKNLEEEIKRYIPRDQCPVPDFMEAVARHFAEWGTEHLRDTTKMTDKSLEEAADIHEAYYDVGEEHGYLYCIRGDIKNAFIAGAKWQTEHLKK